jgi:glycosyltransferase involved in cell wall biosynthesis
MTTDLILNLSENGSSLLNAATENLFVNDKGEFEYNPRLPEILFITSFPPRECGIATYSQDLVTALNNQFEHSFTCAICAKTAFLINKDDNIKLVVMQHEFGFFAKKESDFKQLFDQISKPIVFVFHTVLPNPTIDLKTKVEDMAAIASAIIVMTNDAATILKKEYKVAAYKISVIQHGTHLVPPLNREKLKKHYQLSNKMVLSTFGLLGSSKSIETTLAALPAVIAKFPQVIFLVLGKTHPSVVQHDGEQYRKMLEDKEKELRL